MKRQTRVKGYLKSQIDALQEARREYKRNNKEPNFVVTDIHRRVSFKYEVEKDKNPLTFSE